MAARSTNAFDQDQLTAGRGLFLFQHEEEILLHQAAKNAFDEMGVKKLPKVKELQTEYAKLLEEKKKTYAEYRRSREEMRELLTAKANVDRVPPSPFEHRISFCGCAFCERF